MHSLARFLRRYRGRLIAGATVGVVVTLFLTAPSHAASTSSGNAATGLASQLIFADLLSPIVQSLVSLFGVLSAFIIGLLVQVAQVNNFINSAPVTVGYPIVRDLANMMFIIALLIIAVGTILRLENYRYNRLLGQLIVMAFLVNLSRFITGFFIQTSQVFMLTFVNAFRDIALGNFAYMFGLDAVLKFTQRNITNADSAVFITLVAGLALMVIATCVTLALLVILVVRIVALWILTILSPLAYALRIIPNTNKYAGIWWSEFGKYVVTGPVLAFFLWLALAIAATSGCPTTSQGTCTSANNVLFQGSNQAIQNIGTNSAKDLESTTLPVTTTLVTQLFDPNRLLTFLVSVIFLIMGMQYASKSGTVGAGFAKRTYERGIGAASAISGINAIRDRTIAPVQGWIANRQASRRAAIQERTEGLEQRGAQTRAALGRALPLSQRGTERAQASAERIESQRNARYADERGMQSWNYADLEQAMISSGDSRRRLAAMTTLQTQGKLNLNRDDHNRAFEDISRNVRIPEADRTRLREGILRSGISTMNEATARARLSQAATPAEQSMYVQRLEQLKVLNEDSAADRQIVSNLQGALARTPQALKEFNDGLKRSNPRMALATIYHNFANGLSDGQQLVSDLQQGTFDAANLNVRDVAALSRGLQGGGMSKAEAQSYLGNNILDNARSQQEYNRIMNSMHHQTRDIINNDLAVDQNTTTEKRKWLADQAYIGEAYGQNQNAIDFYMNNNSGQVLKNLKDERLSRATWANEHAVEAIIRQDRINANDLVDATKNIAPVRDTASATLNRITDRINTQATANVDDSSTEGRRQNKIRRSFVAVSGGGDVDDLAFAAAGGPLTGRTRRQISSLEAAFRLRNAAPQNARSGATQALERAVVTMGNKLNKVNWQRLQDAPQGQVIQRAIVENLKISHLADIDERNPGLSRQIYDAIVSASQLPVNTTYGGRPLQQKDIDALTETIKRIKRSDRLPFG